MKISKEFSKYAEAYESRNTIQMQVAKKLLSLVRGEPQKIVDLGCGSGAICRNIGWSYTKLYGIDFAQGMLDLHPKTAQIELLNHDFNDAKLYDRLKAEAFDYILSASALQWAQDLESLFGYISRLDAPVAFAIFTSNTFKTLHQTANIDSMLQSAEEIKRLQERYFEANFEICSYSLEFTSVREMFRYIKRSGVSGARNLLGVKEMKELMRSYPLNYLEFEVVFISS